MPCTHRQNKCWWVCAGLGLGRTGKETCYPVLTGSWANASCFHWNTGMACLERMHTFQATVIHFNNTSPFLAIQSLHMTGEGYLTSSIEIHVPHLETYSRRVKNKDTCRTIAHFMDDRDVALVSSVPGVVVLHGGVPNPRVGVAFQWRQICLCLTRRLPCWKYGLTFYWLIPAMLLAQREKKNTTVLETFLQNIPQHTSHSTCCILVPSPQAVLPPWILESVPSS